LSRSRDKEVKVEEELHTDGRRESEWITRWRSMMPPGRRQC
jgi:hypothetical protein